MSTTNEVRKAYLDESQTTSALKNALSFVLSRSVLPENPYYILADYLLAHNDLSCLQMSGALANELFTNDTKWEDPTKHICRCADCAFGLPHVVLFCTVAGIRDSLFCQSPSPRQADNKGNVMRSICSIGGSALIYVPSWSIFPAIHIRSDVLIASNQIDDAIDAFSLSILRECRAVKRMPLNTWLDIRVLPTSSDYAKTCVQVMPSSQVERDTARFMLMARKAILSSQAIQASFVVAADLPSFSMPPRDASTVFVHVAKAYHLHIQSVAANANKTFIDAESITHYTEPPLAAAYNGIFLDVVATRMYLALYSIQHPTPYAAKNVNASAVLADCRLALAAGCYMDGLCKFAHHALLHCPTVLRAVSTNADLPDWASILSGSHGELSVEVLQEVLMILSSSTSQLTCLANAMWCMQSFTRLTTPETDNLTDVVQDQVRIVPHLIAYTRRLCQLAKRMMADKLLGGLSVIASDKAELLIQQLSETSDSTSVTHTQAALESLELLFRMAASTSASATLLHCTELASALRKLQLLESDILKDLTANLNHKVHWELPAQEACSREKSAGRLPNTLASEGVQLQYAVDTRLDELPALVFEAVTEPPVLNKPFCRILDVVRIHGKDLELWTVPLDTLTMRIANSITRTGPCDSFIYAGRPSETCIATWQAEAKLHTLQTLWRNLRPETIPGLMSGISKQAEGCDIKMTCSFMGDAALSGCMDWANKTDMIQASIGQMKQQESLWYPYHSGRCSQISIEHTYFIEGPSVAAAATEGVKSIWSNLSTVLMSDSYLIVFLLLGGHVISQKSFDDVQDSVLKLLHAHVQRVICVSDSHTCNQIEACKVLLCASGTRCNNLPILLSCHIHCMSLGRGHCFASRPVQYRSWDDDVYARVFISHDAACTWWRHHQSQGCPSQPFHLQKFVSRGRKKAKELAGTGKDYVAALRCSAMVEAAQQDHCGVMVNSRPLANTAYEISCIRKQVQTVRTMLRHLKTSQHENVMINQKQEEVLMLCAKLTTPGHFCQFQGVCIHIKTLLDQIRALQKVTGSESRLEATLQDLDMCLHCCEISCTRAAYMAVQSTLRRRRSVN